MVWPMFVGPSAKHLARSLAVVAALAFVASPFARGLHGMLVEHEVCAHGHLVHVHDDDGHAHVAVSHDHDDVGATLGAPEPTHEHDDCHLALFHRAEAVRAVRASVPKAAPAAEADAPRGPPVEVRAPRVAIYRLAPKTSPPA
jgi:hypothetical protein